MSDDCCPILQLCSYLAARLDYESPTIRARIDAQMDRLVVGPPAPAKTGAEFLAWVEEIRRGDGQ